MLSKDDGNDHELEASADTGTIAQLSTALAKSTKVRDCEVCNKSEASGDVFL